MAKKIYTPAMIKVWSSQSLKSPSFSLPIYDKPATSARWQVSAWVWIKRLVCSVSVMGLPV
ncbi:hypothetical protein CPI40_05680 [Moraxella catarrhalis]|uniref:hypothetical protein n=1 Tax=Moraxella catarrhalis TaxID=480 RepID=UPI0007E2FDD7|nr:hypothetical protein [Moraxella catarrhalis]MPW74621.1 hypothetical protein [Moraxella catarrhalis]OAV10132.1 hypothetical protein AO377_0998 [Moraxella catarrhalis]OAV16601.1 hypothetical protein AO375_0487 [Moraxella catarrhalis]OAV32269.1 hypothetical protein AO368_0534 [Moraxella catarrhalis]